MTTIETYIPDKSKQFLQAAKADGVWDRFNGAKFPDRNRNILGIFCYSPASIKELAQMYALSRVRIGQIIEAGRKSLWHLCSPRIQQQYPLEEVSFAKRRSVYWKELSQLHGGQSVAVLQSLQAGMQPQELSENLGLSRRQITASRWVLRKNGEDAPCLKMTKAESNRLKAALQQPQSDEEMRSLLPKVTKRFYQINNGQNGVLLTLGSILAACGFYYRVTQMEKFVQVLRQAGIPLGIIENSVKSNDQVIKQRYHFIASQHQERAEKALLESPGLKGLLENPVKQVCGPKGSLPSTWQMLKDSEFKALGPLLRKLGFYHHPYAKLFASLPIEECPVPIFLTMRDRNKRNWYYLYRSAEEGKLALFLRNRVKVI